MTAKQPKQIITSIFKKYTKVDGNTVYADKLFIINTIINYLFREENKKNINKDLVYYGEIINRYLNNEVDIYWKSGKIMVKELGQANGETSGG